MKSYFFGFLAFIGFSFQTLNAQFKRSEAVFVEVKGSGINLTLNYDTRFSKKINGIGGSIGFGYLGDKYENAMNLPIAVNYLVGSKRNFFEMGIAAVWSEYNIESDDQAGFVKTYVTHLQGWAFAVIAGYRYQQAGKIFFRIDATPVFSKCKTYPLAGFSVGYSF